MGLYRPATDMAQGVVGQSGGSQETIYLDLWARDGFRAVESWETRTTPFSPGSFIHYFKPQFPCFDGGADAGGNP